MAPVLIGMFFFASVQLFFIGILGEYIANIHTQVQKRPLVVERERINFDQGTDPPQLPRSEQDFNPRFVDRMLAGDGPNSQRPLDGLSIAALAYLGLPALILLATWLRLPFALFDTHCSRAPPSGRPCAYIHVEWRSTASRPPSP
jgi:hypothetical protein